MNRRIFSAILFLALASLACQVLIPQAEPTAVVLPTQPQQIQPVLPQNPIAPQTEAQVPRIGVKEAKAALDSGQAILIDVRSAEAYAERHAVGALSISLDNFESNSVSFPKEQWIITYCT